MLHTDTFKKMFHKIYKKQKSMQIIIFYLKCIKHCNEHHLLNMQDKINSMCVDRIFELEDNGKYESFFMVLNNKCIQHPYTVIRGHKQNLNKVI